MSGFPMRRHTAPWLPTATMEPDPTVDDVLNITHPEGPDAFLDGVGKVGSWQGRGQGFCLRPVGWRQRGQRLPHGPAPPPPPGPSVQVMHSVAEVAFGAKAAPAPSQPGASSSTPTSSAEVATEDKFMSEVVHPDLQGLLYAAKRSPVADRLSFSEIKVRSQVQRGCAAGDGAACQPLDWVPGCSPLSCPLAVSPTLFVASVAGQGVVRGGPPLSLLLPKCVPQLLAARAHARIIRTA
jgi:hypothetical protein